MELYHILLGRKIPYRLEPQPDGILNAPDGDCHIPTDRKPMRDGYYQIVEGRRRQYVLHRLMVSVKYKVSYDSFEVARHLCHNKGCFNPDHLKIGTYRDNMDDTRFNGKKGTGIKTLTDDEAREAYQLALPYQEIADLFGVAVSVINLIKVRSTYIEATEGLTRGDSPLSTGRPLTADQVKEIYVSTDPYEEIAKRYGIGYHTVDQIKGRRGYKNVTVGLTRGRPLTEADKITTEQAREIFVTKLTFNQLAEQYDIKYGLVRRIKERRAFASATEGLVRDSVNPAFPPKPLDLDSIFD